MVSSSIHKYFPFSNFTCAAAMCHTSDYEWFQEAYTSTFLSVILSCAAAIWYTSDHEWFRVSYINDYHARTPYHSIHNTYRFDIYTLFFPLLILSRLETIFDLLTKICFDSRYFICRYYHGHQQNHDLLQ